jgi:hypothetical protein
MPISHALNPTGQLVLVSIRMWVMTHLRCRPSACAWYEGLQVAGLGEAAIGALDDCLTMLAMLPDGLTGVLPMCAHRLSTGERELLRSCAVLQDAEQCPLDFGAAVELPATARRAVAKRYHLFARELGRVVGPIQIRSPDFVSDFDRASGSIGARIH